MVEYLSGTLYKRRGGFGKFMGKKWEKRGFIFSSEGIIAYYDAEIPPADCNVASARGYLDLKQNPFYLNTKGIVDAQPTPYTLIIAPINSEKFESWKLCTETSAEFELWFKALEVFATPRTTPLSPGDYKSDDEREQSVDSPRGNNNSFDRPESPMGGLLAKAGRRGSSIGAHGPLLSTPTRGNADLSGSEDENQQRPRTGSSARPLPPPPPQTQPSAVHVDYMSSAPPPTSTAVGATTVTSGKLPAATPTDATKTLTGPSSATPAAVHVKKRTGGLKLKKAAPTITPVFKQAFAVCCVVTSCMYGATLTQSTLVFLFYLVVANIVVFQTIMFQDLIPLHGATACGASVGSSSGGGASAGNAAASTTRKGSVSGAAAANVAAAVTGGGTTASVTGASSSSPVGDTNISTPAVPEGPPVAGASFERVYTVAPNVPEHTWCQCDHKQFQTRIGPDYKKHGKKAPSSTPIYEPCGVDVICTKARKDHIAERMALFDTSDIRTNHPHVPPLFIVQMQIPSDPPPNLWTSVEDGPGWAIVMYFKITEDSCQQLLNFETASPALKLFAQYCEKADKDPAWRSRFKIICSCLNLDQMGLPSMIVSYNAKPVLIRRTGTFYKGKNHAEFDVHVHKFANLAKQSIHMISSRCGEMFMQIGFVIEGRENDELPETLFGCVGINKPQEERGEFIFPEDQTDDDEDE